MDLRKNIYSLTPGERNNFRDAVNALKANGTYDAFIQRHNDAMMDTSLMPGETTATTQRGSAHRGPAFGPWHRRFIRDFELALQSVIAGVTLPYWDWAQDATLANPAAAPLWTDAYIGGDGAGPNNLVPNGPFKNWVALIMNAGGMLVPRATPGIVRILGRDPIGFPTLPSPAQVANSMAEGVYDSAPWSESQTSSPSFRNRLEGWLTYPGEPAEPRMHNRVHTWVGGDMQPGTSPNDPVFFLHHCNVDRLWAQWQAAKPGLPYVPNGGGPPGHNLMDAMRDIGAAGITPASVLDHLAMGYRYDTEPPAASYAAGWNLVGGPAGTVFSQALDPLYTFRPGDVNYEAVPAAAGVQAGYGYWAYFLQPAGVSLSGVSTNNASVAVPTGNWVLVGNPSATEVLTIYGATAAWAFDTSVNDYALVSSLQPGSGAWVTVTAGGVVTLAP